MTKKSISAVDDNVGMRTHDDTVHRFAYSKPLLGFVGLGIFAILGMLTVTKLSVTQTMLMDYVLIGVAGIALITGLLALKGDN